MQSGPADWIAWIRAPPVFAVKALMEQAATLAFGPPASPVVAFDLAAADLVGLP